MGHLPDAKGGFRKLEAVLSIRDKALVGVLIQFLGEQGVELSVDAEDALYAAVDHFPTTEAGQLLFKEVEQIKLQAPSLS